MSERKKSWLCSTLWVAAFVVGLWTWSGRVTIADPPIFTEPPARIVAPDPSKEIFEMPTMGPGYEGYHGYWETTPRGVWTEGLHEISENFTHLQDLPGRAMCVWRGSFKVRADVFTEWGPFADALSPFYNMNDEYFICILANKTPNLLADPPTNYNFFISLSTYWKDDNLIRHRSPNNGWLSIEFKNNDNFITCDASGNSFLDFFSFYVLLAGMWDGNPCIDGSLFINTSEFNSSAAAAIYFKKNFEPETLTREEKRLLNQWRTATSVSFLDPTGTFAPIQSYIINGEQRITIPEDLHKNEPIPLEELQKGLTTPRLPGDLPSQGSLISPGSSSNWRSLLSVNPEEYYSSLLAGVYGVLPAGTYFWKDPDYVYDEDEYELTYEADVFVLLTNNGGTEASDPGWGRMPVIGDGWCDELGGETPANSSDCVTGNRQCSLYKRAAIANEITGYEAFLVDCVPPETAEDGDGWCQRDLGENVINDPADCFGSLFDQTCSRGEGEDLYSDPGECSGYIGDAVCQYWEGENYLNSPDCVTVGVGNRLEVDGECKWWLGETPDNCIDCRVGQPSMTVYVTLTTETIPYYGYGPVLFMTDGGSLSFTALGESYTDGNISSSIQWSSSLDSNWTPTGATVSASSLTTGFHWITMTVTDTNDDTAMSHFMFEVDAVPSVEISGNPSYVHGTSTTISATATSAPRGNIASSIVWTSNIQTLEAVGPTLDVSTLNVGTHTLTATATNQAGGTGYDTFQVTISDALPVLTISTWTQPVQEHGTIYLGGTATDYENGSLSNYIQWIDYNTSAVYAVGANVSFSADSLNSPYTPGYNQVFARITDPTTSVVVDTEPHWITVSPGPSTLVAGAVELGSASSSSVSVVYTDSEEGGIFPISSILQRSPTGTEEWADVEDSWLEGYWEDSTVTELTTYDYRVKFWDAGFVPAVVYSNTVTVSAADPQPTITGMVSRRSPGGINWDIPFQGFSATNAGGTTTIPVECRLLGVLQVVVTFDDDVVPSDGTWGATGGTTEIELSGGTLGNVTHNGNVLSFTVTGTNATGSCLGVTLRGIEYDTEDPTSSIFETIHYIKVLGGDVDGDGDVEGEVNPTPEQDVQMVMDASGMPMDTDANYFRRDVTGDGSISGGDINMVKGYKNYALSGTCGG